MIDSYTIVGGTSAQDVVNHCNSLIQQGWQPHGGLTLTSDSDIRTEENVPMLHFAQAMVMHKSLIDT